MAKCGMVQPRNGRYGICGWDVIIVGMSCLLFPTKGKAVKWMKEHGYDILDS